MAGEYKRRWREHIVDCARLIGYDIVKEPTAERHSWVVYIHGSDKPFDNAPEWATIHPRSGMRFQYAWKAAVWALNREGIDARTLIPPGKDGAAASAPAPVPVERNRAARVARRARRPRAKRNRKAGATPRGNRCRS